MRLSVYRQHVSDYWQVVCCGKYTEHVYPCSPDSGICRVKDERLITINMCAVSMTWGLRTTKKWCEGLEARILIESSSMSADWPSVAATS